MVCADLLGCFIGVIRILIEAKASCARTGHACQVAVFVRVNYGEHIGDNRCNTDRGFLQIIALCSQPVDYCERRKAVRLSEDLISFFLQTIQESGSRKFFKTSGVETQTRGFTSMAGKGVNPIAV